MDNYYIYTTHQYHLWYLKDSKDGQCFWTKNVNLAKIFYSEEAVEQFRLANLSSRKTEIQHEVVIDDYLTDYYNLADIF